MFKKKDKEKIYKVEEKVLTPEEKIEKFANKENKALPNPLYGVKFWLLAIAAAMLLVMGIWIILDNSLGVKLGVGFTGLVIVIFGLIRIVPLVRTQKATNSKLLIVGEIIIDILIGAFLFYGAFKVQQGENTKIGDFVTNYYRYFLGFVLYIKAVFYFITTSLLNEKTTKFEFWIHILIMSVAVVVFALDFDASHLAIFIAVLCLLSGLASGLTAGGSYYLYRKNVVRTKTVEKEETTKEEEGVILPEVDEDKKQPFVS